MTPPTPPAYDLSENSVIWLAHLVVFSNALARCQRQRAVALWLVRNLPLLPPHPVHWPYFRTNPIFLQRMVAPFPLPCKYTGRDICQ